jgi:hypothetical protein
MVCGSIETRSCSRSAGSRLAASAAAASTTAFHSAAVLGKTFQVGLIGAPMIRCSCGLTVSGAGMVRVGSSRGGGDCAPACADMVTANARTSERPSSARRVM